MTKLSNQEDPQRSDQQISPEPVPAGVTGLGAVSDARVDRNLPGFAHHATLVQQSPGLTEVVKLTPTTAEFFNSAGEQIGSDQLSIELRPEDVVGVLPYNVEGGELLVYATECVRPALLAREEIGLPALAGTAGARVLSELGGYLGSVDGLGQAAEAILSQKAALVPSGHAEMIGGLLIPNASVSAELVLPTAVPVHRPPRREYEVTGAQFNAGRITVELSAQQVADAFYQGRLSDPRLFLSVSELYEQLRGGTVRDEPLAVALPQLDEVRSQLQSVGTRAAPPIPFLCSAEEVLRYQHEEPNDPGVVVSARVTDDSASADAPLFRSARLLVRLENSKGEEVEAPFAAEAIVREHDTMLVVVLARCGDQIFLPVNNGARAALEVRDRTPHVVHTVTGARNLEGVSGVLTVPYDDRGRVAERVREIVFDATGHECVCAPVLTPIAGYFSPGFNTAGFRLACAVIDLDETSIERLPSGTVLAEPRALLDAGVRDLSLRLCARVACDVLALEREKRSEALSGPEREEFQRIMLSESSVWRFIREHSPRLREIMKEKPLLANILNKRVNDGGLEIEQRAADDPEHYFFNSLMQNFMLHRGENPLRVVQLLWHDFWHYEHADVLPFRNTTSGVAPVSAAEYTPAVTFNEVDGVMFSDVVLVNLYGVEAFEREIGYGSLAGFLQSAGITELDDQRAVVARAHEQGELDPRLVRFLSESGKLPYYNDVVREKLLGIYARDTLENIPILHQAWASMPNVAALAIKMGAATMDQWPQGAEHFSDRLDALVTGQDTEARSGRNPLREALGQLRTYGVYQQALKLEYLRGLLEERGAGQEVSEIGSLTAELVDAYEKLRVSAQSVESIEESAQNIAAFRQLRSVSNGVVERSRSMLGALLSDNGPLSVEERERLSRWTHAPFPILAFDPRAEERTQARVDECLQKSFAAVGLTFPG